MRRGISLESEKEKTGFLAGVPGIVDAIRSGKITCRVYRKDKFHAKAYITHARMEVVGSSALVGSANFTYPGLTENIELNVQITGQPVSVLQEWYEEREPGRPGGGVATSSTVARQEILVGARSGEDRGSRKAPSAASLAATGA
jgi:phosphatidylserine/phosphatidylglycerophosphate/cardiolipin synthase-like enzyme